MLLETVLMLGPCLHPSLREGLGCLASVENHTAMAEEFRGGGGLGLELCEILQPIFCMQNMQIWVNQNTL